MKLFHFLVLFFVIFCYSCKTDTQPIKDKVEVAAKVEPPKTNDSLEKFGVDENVGNSLGGLKVGDQAPDFTLNDSQGKEVNLHSVTKNGPAVITFYRAHWCGYCTKHLAEFQDEMDILGAKGVNVMAISPELPIYSSTVIEQNKLSYPILFDENHDVAKAYKVLFHVNQMYQDRLSDALDKSISMVNGDTEAKMPIPATYVIGKDNLIKYVFYNPDYSKRAPMTEIKSILDSL